MARLVWLAAVMRYVVGHESEFQPGSVHVIEIGNPRGIGVFNVGGRLYALKNLCPHQGGPLCQGVITGTAEGRLPEKGPPQHAWVREGEIIRCPWHRWEFEIATGKTVFRSKMRVATYRVLVKENELPPASDMVQTYAVTVEDHLVIVEI